LAAVRLGVHIGHWSGDPFYAVGVARQAESLGFDCVWASEAWSSDAVTVLTWLAAHTDRIGVGAAVLQMPARTPAATAMTTATLDHLSGGRFRLGLGTSGPAIAEGWHGVAFDDPAGWIREYVTLVRSMLARDEPVTFDGRRYSLPARGGTGRGRAMKLGVRPLRTDVPIYLGVMGERTVALAAEIADGWMPLLFSPERAGIFSRSLAEGFERRGGRPEGFDVSPMVWVAIGDDLAACRDHVRPHVAMYVGGMGPRDRNFYNRLVARMGFEQAAAAIAVASLEGRKAEAVAAVPDELVDEVALVGPVERARDRLDAWRAAGVTTIVARTTDVEQLRAVARAAGPTATRER
jgi:F420-dependent oxidoreductase-like protein